jgi:hypothetical protein
LAVPPITCQNAYCDPFFLSTTLHIVFTDLLKNYWVWIIYQHLHHGETKTSLGKLGSIKIIAIYSTNYWLLWKCFMWWKREREREEFTLPLPAHSPFFPGFVDLILNWWGCYMISNKNDYSRDSIWDLAHTWFKPELISSPFNTC